MPRSSGTYTLPAGNPVTTGTTITSTWANTTLSDIATALTGSVATDGTSPMTGILQMGNNKITGVANGTASTDVATVFQYLILLLLAVQLMALLLVLLTLKMVLS